MNVVIEYAKKASTAFKTYTKGETIDYDLCEKIYEYIQNIENLNKEEKDELDTFITNNTFHVVHLANIYINQERKKTLKKQLIRMIPISMSKSDGKIYEARGNFSSLENFNYKKPLKIKTKTYAKNVA